MKNYENSAPAALIGMRCSVVEYRRAVTKLMKGVGYLLYFSFIVHGKFHVAALCRSWFLQPTKHTPLFIVAPRRLDFNYSLLPTKKLPLF